MSTSGAKAGQAFNFNFSFVDSADPTSFYTTQLQTSEVNIYQRNGASLSGPVAITTQPTVSGSIHTISLTSGEMVGPDEVVLEFSGTGFVSENVSISLEASDADVVSVAASSVAGINDFKADVSSLATSAEIAALNDIAATDIVSGGPITTLAGAVVNVDTVDTVTTNSDMISVSSIVNGVWDESQAGHVTVGTFGYYLDGQISGIAGGGGGTDWTATEKNQIRYRLGVDGTAAVPTATPDLSTFDAATDTVTTDTASREASKADVSALATQASVDVVDANVDAILVDTGTTLPASISTIDSNVDAVLVDTGTTIPATLSTISGKVDTVDAVADLIKVDTTAILDDTGTSGVAISTAQAQAIADEILKRSVGNVEGATLDEHSLATVVLAILESQRVGASWTIYRTDGTTAQATKTLTLDASAQPVTRVQ